MIDSHIYGQDVNMDCWKIGIMLIRGMGPVSRGAIISELLDQVPNASDEKIRKAGDLFIRQALERRVIAREEGEGEYYNMVPAKHS